MFDPEELVARCRSALHDADPESAVREVVAEAVAEPAALCAAVPQLELGGQMTWHRSPELTVQVIVWPPGIVTPPHEHRMWAVVGVVAGREDNEIWRRTPIGVERSTGRSIGAGELVVLGGDAVHSVTNPLRSATVGLHVYGGDILAEARSEWDHDGRNEHPFEGENVLRLLGLLEARSRQVGRPLRFEEIREASLNDYLARPSR